MSINAVNTASDYFAVTPDDSTNFTQGEVRALYVGTGGNVVAVKATDGTTVTFSNVVSGTVLPIRCIRVNSTSTTASNIVGLL